MLLPVIGRHQYSIYNLNPILVDYHSRSMIVDNKIQSGQKHGKFKQSSRGAQICKLHIFNLFIY